MEVFLLVLSILCAFGGVVGAVLPIIPGPPLSLIAIWLLQLSHYQSFSSTFLWIVTLLTIVISILDYIAPVWLTKQFGGTQLATRGTLLGLLIGLFFMPWGIIVGPFFGAFIGEMLAHKDTTRAFRIALLSFVSFLLTTGIKLMFGFVLLYYVISSLF